LTQNITSAAVPAATISAVTRAASALATPTLAADIVSTNVLALTQGAMKSMVLTNLPLRSLVLLAVAAFGIGVSATAYSALAVGPDQAPAARTADSHRLPDADTKFVAYVGTAEDTKNILQNGGMEEGDGSPAHWSQGAEIDGVEYIWDKETGYKSKASLCLHKTANRYFPIAQWYQVASRQGDSAAVRVTAQVKAEKVTKAILDVIFLDASDEPISHKWAAYIGAKQAADPPANHDWKKYSGRVAVPAAAKKIQVALQIYGPGKVWFDDVRAEYVK
jgi:hypothetical protein